MNGASVAAVGLRHGGGGGSRKDDEEENDREDGLGAASEHFELGLSATVK